jgi:hypothetical protein
MSTPAIIALTVLVTLAYLGVGYLVATKVAIEAGGLGTCLILWPLVIIFFGLFGAFCFCANRANGIRAWHKRSRSARA